MIVCGWCGQPATDTCVCGRDPRVPWVQRGLTPKVIEAKPGRPEIDANDIHHRLAQARAALPGATNAQLAEHLDISIRTLGRWLRR